MVHGEASVERTVGPSAHLLSREMLAALVVVGCVGFGTNLTIQLINLGMHSRGASSALIGLSTMLQAVGIVVAAPLAPTAMRLFGIKCTMIAGAVIATGAMLAFAQAADFAVITVLRVIYAAGLALVFTCAEFLMLASTPPQKRGLTAGLYATALGCGMIAGPMSIGAFGLESSTAIYIGALACLICVPAAVLGMNSSALPRERRARYRFSLLGVSPLAFGAAFTFGFLDNGPVSLLGVFGMQHGWSVGHAALLVSAVTLSAIACQTPIGWAVDRYDARLVLRGGCLLAAVLLLALPHVWFAPIAVLGCVIALGAVMEGLYTVGLADLGKRVDGAQLSAANAFFVMVCGAGEVVGPLVTGWAIDALK